MRERQIGVAGERFAVAVLGSDGTPDHTFGTNGLATTHIPRGDGYAVDIDLLLRGRRVTVAGTAGGDILAARYLLPTP